jgi:hypothetical protein
MDDKLELWTVMTFDDAAARIALPPHERWIPADRRRKTSAPLAALAAALVVFVFGAAVWLVADGRLVPAAPTAKPAPSNLIRLAPGGTEAQTWGKVWSVATGVTVLRPTWLPVSDLDTSYDVMATSRGGLYRYIVGYYPRSVSPTAPRPPRLLFIAEGPDVLPPQLGPGDRAENVTVRGQAGRLITAPGDEARVVWSENGIRYTIQAAAGISSTDVLRIAESLAPVVDAEGSSR